jgi:hypothetical protein
VAADRCSFSLGFNLDSFMIHFLVDRETGVGLAEGSAARYISPWGEPTTPWVHSVLWMLAVPVVATILACRRPCAVRCCPKDVRWARSCMLDVGLVCSIVLALPAQLALLRVYSESTNAADARLAAACCLSTHKVLLALPSALNRACSM